MILRVDDLEITLERRKVKNINLYIQPPDGRILVTAPRRASREQIVSFIRSKRDWIARTQQRVRERSREAVLTPPEEITGEEIKRLQGWIEKYAAIWEPRLGVHCRRWTIRYMKTRWGSCSVDRGTIRINSRLARAGEQAAEMVIVHELIHLLVPGHDAEFYRYLENCIPDWRERQNRLRQV